jgi:hypothetical protein
MTNAQAFRNHTLNSRDSIEKRKPMRTFLKCASLLALLLTISPAKTIAQDQLPAPATETRKPDAVAADNPEQKDKKRWSFVFSGELNNYFISESHAMFADEAKAWLETSASLSGRFSYKHVAVEMSVLGVKTTGRDPFGTGTAAPGSLDLPGTFPDFRLEKAFVEFSEIGGSSLKATLGRQPIAIGSQFLVGDGVYDGFAPNVRQAVYHNPRKSFDAVRLEWDVKKIHFDSFAFRVDPSWDAAGGHDGVFGGIDVSRHFDENKATYAAGLFYRHSPSKADNNMALLDLRGEQHLPGARDFYVGGELVFEFAGSCRNIVYCTTPAERLGERAGHLEFGYESSRSKWRPSVEAGYVYYSKDFVPIATGFSDWGKWYLGNQIDWIVFGSNTSILRAQVGFWPGKSIRLRAQFHNTRQVSPTGASTGGSLTNELSYIAEWYPRDKLWFNVVVGDSRPGSALAASGLTNSFAFLNSGAATVGSQRSIDFVFATGVRF